MEKKALFHSLVNDPNGKKVVYPGKPYHPTIVRIYPYDGKALELDVVFKAYTKGKEPLLEWIKDVDIWEKKKKHTKVSPSLSPIVDSVPPELSEEIEDLPSELDTRADVSKEDVEEILQEVAVVIDPSTKSMGFSSITERSTTIKDLYKFVTERRKLVAKHGGKTNDIPRKAEWVSIALNGYTDTVDKSKHQLNTKRWAKRWYLKPVLEELFASKSVEVKKGSKAGDLFDQAWDSGWLARDSHDVGSGIAKS